MPAVSPSANATPSDWRQRGLQLHLFQSRGERERLVLDDGDWWRCLHIIQAVVKPKVVNRPTTQWQWKFVKGFPDQNPSIKTYTYICIQWNCRVLILNVDCVHNLQETSSRNLMIQSLVIQISGWYLFLKFWPRWFIYNVLNFGWYKGWNGCSGWYKELICGNCKVLCPTMQ